MSDTGLWPEGLPSRRLREVASTDPKRLAVKLGPECVTYGQLDAMADALAWQLQEQLGPGDQRVGHCVGSAVAMIVSDLALDRAGKVAVGLSPSDPPERLRSLLGSARCSLLISDLGALAVDDVARIQPFGHPDKGRFDPTSVTRPELLAITFTSGSEGQPKGVMRSRRWSTHLAAWAEALDVEAGTRGGLLFAGPSATASLGIEVNLSAGGSGSIFDLRSQGIDELPAWIENEQVTRMVFVPTVLRILLAGRPDPHQLRRLSLIALGGEAATWDDVAAVRPYLDPEARIRVGFGLAEAGLVAQYVVTPDMDVGTGPLPTGKPMPGVTITIVDQNGMAVENGRPGEIVVDGVHCATGYWEQPELSALTFSELPDGRRRVRTGDAGLLGQDGNLVHLGRLDQMVKISGNRVDLAEVEAGLLAVDGISQAAGVTYVDGLGNTRLRAYVVADATAVVHPRVVRAMLSRRLPGPMIPDAIEVLPDLPMLPGGKIDRPSLPRRIPDDPKASERRVAPATDRERQLLAIWSDVLGLDRVGVHENFFELGGDSLRAAQLFTRMQEQLGIDRPVSMLFEAPTIALLATMVDAEAEAFDVIVPFRVGGAKPPLFVVHGRGGNILFVRHLLSQLPEDQPVYGIQPPLAVSSGRALPEQSVPELARRYCVSLRQVQPQGPYLIYGYSFGGWVAFEMALQLQADGELVSLLALGDTPAPIYLKKHRGRTMTKRLSDRITECRDVGGVKGIALFATYCARVSRGKIKALRESPQRRQISRALAEGGPVPPGLRTAYMKGVLSALARNYEPTGVFEGPVAFIKATGTPHEPLLWEPQVTGSVRIFEIATGHGSLAHPPQTTHVGNVLARVIDGAGEMVEAESSGVGSLR
jgi:acyl-coenzyme A synthetase/AMP-(fatty) acid ligase/thioesterase domain-containing protein/acyl carrier protein